MEALKFQVFISSTFKDLMDERLAVMKAIMGLNCIPAGMEDFPAVDEEQLEFIKRIIDDCDYYVLIMGGKYGSYDETGVSYTEREYDYAKSTGKTVLAFPHASINTLPADKIELDERVRERLESFRNKVMENRVVRLWETPTELPGLVAISLSQSMRQKPGIGWVRGGGDSTLEVVQHLKETREEVALKESRIQDLMAKIERLENTLSNQEDDAYSLYKTIDDVADKMEQEDDLNRLAREREIALRAAERLLEEGKKQVAPPNILFNAAVSVSKLQSDVMALKLHTLAQALQPSLSHEIAKKFYETKCGVRFTATAKNGTLSLSQDSTSPEEVASDALNAALLMVADGPIAQCEIVYSQVWNICQVQRDKDAMSRARLLLIKSLAHREQDKELLELTGNLEDEAIPHEFDWTLQVGKSVPSYMVQKIAEMTAFESRQGWIQESRKWLKRAERSNAAEYPSVTWYKSTIREIEELAKKMLIAERRLAEPPQL